MKYFFGVSNFLEEISSLSNSIVFLYFFALVTEEGFFISPCYSLELCIQMDISFLSPLPFASLEGLRDCHTEWSKSNREIEISCDITYAEPQKMIYKWTYLQNRNREKNLWLLGGKVTVREFGTDMYTLLYLKRVINKNILYTTGLFNIM